MNWLLMSWLFVQLVLISFHCWIFLVWSTWNPLQQLFKCWTESTLIVGSKLVSRVGILTKKILFGTEAAHSILPPSLLLWSFLPSFLPWRCLPPAESVTPFMCASLITREGRKGATNNSPSIPPGLGSISWPKHNAEKRYAEAEFHRDTCK